MSVMRDAEGVVRDLFARYQAARVICPPNGCLMRVRKTRPGAPAGSAISLPE